MPSRKVSTKNAPQLQANAALRGRMVRCSSGSQSIEARYEVDGRFILLHSPFGSHKAAIGVQTPRRLAAKLLKNICGAYHQVEKQSAGETVVLPRRAEKSPFIKVSLQGV